MSSLAQNILTTSQKYTSGIPGQSFGLQALVSTLGPLHAPPHADALDCIDPIHMRMRSCTPEPHDLLHLLQSPHLLHPKNSTREWFTLIRQINLLP